MEGAKTKKLKSSDNVVKEVSVDLLQKSKLLKGLIEDYQGDDEEIPLNEVDSKNLELIIQYLEHYKDTEPKEIPKPFPERTDDEFLKGILNDQWTFDYLQKLSLDDLINLVNAANYTLLGCFIPLHNCIDNCIHSAAGVQLRWDCHEIIRRQGHDEPTGRAQITPGYCLPAKYVLHTVGPIVDTELTDEHRELLASSYRSCLDLAAENGLGNVAFCCISTGVFCFPAEEAARIAVKIVRDWLDSHDSSIDKVIFNVFGNRDKEIYEKILG